MLDAEVHLGLGTLALDVSVQVGPGRVVAVLGPNGAGKTTLVRALVGLVALDDGAITLDGRTLDRPADATFVVPEQRRIAYVPQGLMLFPHLSVVDNVAFGPRSAGASRSASRRAAEAWLERMGLGEHARSRPRALSGGQAQRVALARALVAAPDLLLLDEPLSALDVATRAETRRALREHLGAFDGAGVLVTHDPVDALLLADDIVILEQGAVTQAGPVAEVAARPRTRYVADLMGSNLLRGVGRGRTVTVGSTSIAVAEPAPADAFVSIGPSSLTLHLLAPEGSARNAWPATVASIDRLGDRVRVHLDGSLPLVAEITPAALTELGLAPGRGVWVTAKATELVAYPV